MKFTELNLHPRVLASVEAQSFTECTPIQESSIHYILAGKDVAGLAQTGTGKTAAYLIPLMDRILRSREAGEESKLSLENSDDQGLSNEKKEEENTSVQGVPFNSWQGNNFILVLVPTRELAEQVLQNVKTLGASLDLTGVAVYGGMSYEPQKRAINRGVQFVIATPGRLIDLFKEHIVDLNQVRAVVFDEADRMFDMGFKDDMKYLLRRIPGDRQFLVFSATLNFDVLNTAYEFGSHPVEVNVSKDQAKAENVQDEIFHVGDGEKPQFLLSLLRKYQPRQAIVFSNFKSQVERVAKFLSDNETPAMGISSLLTQAQRNRVMSQFKKEGNNRNILVATDVAARGLDIKGVDLVINYELPEDPENYIHRIGRTGRAGEAGKAFSLSSDRDVEALARIENYVGHKVTIGWMEEADLVKEFEKFPERTEYKQKRDGRKDRDSFKKKGKGGSSSNRRPRKGKDENSRREGPQKHRDRLSGRHKNNSSEENPNNGQNFKGKKPNRDQRKDSQRDQKKSSSKQKVYKHRPRSDRFDPSRKTQRPAEPAKAASESIGQKVSGFFKRLFS